MNKENVELTKRLRDFFQIYLPKQKCYSENTVTSYKYAFNLFFDFLNSRKGIGMTKITMAVSYTHLTLPTKRIV